jgi:hypothetical protein
MPFTKILDMAYEVNGDHITIEQDAGCGEIDTVSLHAIHVRLIAGEMGMLRGTPDESQRVEALQRRLHVLRDRIQELDELLWSVPCFPPGEVTHDCRMSEMLMELANEFCADVPDRRGTHGQPTENPRDTADVTQGHAASRTVAAEGQLNLEGVEE